MLKSFFFALRFFTFWLIFFLADRLIFLLYFSEKLRDLPPAEILKTFIYGLWMDASMAGYIAAIPVLALLAVSLFPALLRKSFLKWYSRVLIVIFAFITIVNFNIYREWGTKINYRALDFAFTAPNEAMASSASSPIFSSFAIFFAFIGLFLWLSRYFTRFAGPEKTGLGSRLALWLGIAALTFLAIRGGWQLSPMNESMAYFSDRPVLNHAAINTEWALVHDIIANKSGQKNPYEYFEPDRAKQLVKELYKTTNDSSARILTTSRPNVVVIILESHTADVVASLGGEEGVSPQLDRLAKNGVLFSNIYASGDRTDKGLIAVLSGFPSQAIRSIVKSNNKQEKLPSLSQTFAGAGYRTSFYYGGESEFFNVKSYVLTHAYQQLVDKPAYDPRDMNSKWGAYDHAVYARQLDDMTTVKQPFFSTIQTLTNHEPFELPGKAHFAGDDLPNKFRSTAWYADSTLANYLAQAKGRPWYKNTLFIIVADHGHHLPLAKYEIYDPHRFRIPLVFFGDVIKPEYRGKVIDKFGGQTDIARTLFTQLGIDASGFTWSKDLLNKGSRDFSFYDWDNGFGFATPQQTISFDNTGRSIIYRKNPAEPVTDEKLATFGKAYMQRVFQEYLDF